MAATLGSLANAISAFAGGRLCAAKELMSKVKVTSTGRNNAEELTAQRLKSNLSGLLAHYSGDFAKATVDLKEALDITEAQGRMGQAHDSFLDLTGVLIDIAVNEMAKENFPAAQAHLKRAKYMAGWAYKPEWKAVSMCHTGLAELLSRDGDTLAALQQSFEAQKTMDEAVALRSPRLQERDSWMSVTTQCTRSRCLRLSGMPWEALEVSTAAVDGLGDEPPPLIYARVLTTHALAQQAARGVGDVEARLNLEHAFLLLAEELPEDHPDLVISGNNLDGVAVKVDVEMLSDLLLLPPGLGLADDDPYVLTWRPQL